MKGCGGWTGSGLREGNTFLFFVLTLIAPRGNLPQHLTLKSILIKQTAETSRLSLIGNKWNYENMPILISWT